MDAYEPFLTLGVALVAGLVIGFEREQSASARLKDEAFLFGGVRTHSLFALLGAVSTLVSRQLGVGVFLAGFGALLVLLALGYRHDLERGSGGTTSEAAVLLTYVLGALATTTGVIEPLSRRMLLVLGIAVVSTVLLSVKPVLRGFVQQVSRADIFATLKFLLVAVVVLPLLPDEAMGPLQVLNPRRIGFMVVLIAGLSFVGYVAIRWLGPNRGLGVTGIVGGLASSTAVTLAMSRHARREPTLQGSSALAIVLASTIMFGRVLVVVAVASPMLVGLLAVPTAAMAAAGVVVSLLFYLRSRKVRGQAGEVELSNPFELRSALFFALLFAAVLLGTKALTVYAGSGSTYVAAVIAGSTDVDAITLSMANLAGSGLSREVAVTGILLAMIANTAAKAGISAAVGGWSFGKRVLLSLGGVSVVGLVALFAARALMT